MSIAGSEAKALQVMDFLVARQASMLAYNHVYLLIAFVYLFSIPLVLLLKTPRHLMTKPVGIVAE